MNNERNHSFHTLFAPIIAGIFAISVFVVLIFGANTYSGIVKKSAAEYDQRISLSYICAKIHRADEQNTIMIGSFNYLPALYINENYDDVRYNTVIYAYDGWLRELFCEQGVAFLPQDGTPLLEATDLQFSYAADQLLCVRFTDNMANSQQIYINLRSKGGDY